MHLALTGLWYLRISLAIPSRGDPAVATNGENTPGVCDRSLLGSLAAETQERCVFPNLPIDMVHFQLISLEIKTTELLIE